MVARDAPVSRRVSELCVTVPNHVRSSTLVAPWDSLAGVIGLTPEWQRSMSARRDSNVFDLPVITT
jgi:hypothetical protein